MATATEQLRAEVAQAKSYGDIRLRLDIEVPIALLDEALAEMDLEREKYARALVAKDEGLDALRAERDAQRAATFEAIDRHQQAHAQAEFFKGEMQALRTERDALRAGFRAAVKLLDSSTGVPCRPDLDDQVRSALAALEGA